MVGDALIPALLASVGLPLLVKAVGGALGMIDNPVAKTAAEALDGVGKAMDAKAITPEQVAEGNRHMERMAEIDADREMEIIGQVNATMRAETQADDPYTRRWRPTWGYVTAFTWGVQGLAVVFCLLGATWAAIDGKADVVTALLTGAASLAGALSIQWAVALSVLGVSVVKRSDDKAVAAGQAPAPGLLGALANRIAGAPK